MLQYTNDPDYDDFDEWYYEYDIEYIDAMYRELDSDAFEEFMVAEYGQDIHDLFIETFGRN